MRNYYHNNGTFTFWEMMQLLEQDKTQQMSDTLNKKVNYGAIWSVWSHLYTYFLKSMCAYDHGHNNLEGCSWKCKQHLPLGSEPQLDGKECCFFLYVLYTFIHLIIAITQLVAYFYSSPLEKTESCCWNLSQVTPFLCSQASHGSRVTHGKASRCFAPQKACVSCPSLWLHLLLPPCSLLSRPVASWNMRGVFRPRDLCTGCSLCLGFSSSRSL